MKHVLLLHCDILQRNLIRRNCINRSRDPFLLLAQGLSRNEQIEQEKLRRLSSFHFPYTFIQLAFSMQVHSIFEVVGGGWIVQWVDRAMVGGGWIVVVGGWWIVVVGGSCSGG